ncbi:synaptic vesicle glycoprotein 2B-like [Sitophilus oryzae]|uniref:Synaptic vesicle glycoprotein 2B-like n=1 Tax=Sitophilus oryzae TaxID=7048 RepID=A0A6J2YKG0_SITOR|nr:synaptic vesicle glycoprotein 2B-like [Sitophilus oryzae]
MLENSEVYMVKESKLYNEAVSLTGYGIYNIFILLATGGCLMCVIIETMSMAFIIPAAQCDLNLNLSEKGILASISFLGVMTTSQFWGFLADTRGRKNILVFCLISSSLVSLGCSLVPWSWLFILLRFINGALIGGSSSIIYAFAGEFHSDRFRPMIVSWISSFVAAGQMYIPGMAWKLLPNTWSYDLEGLGITFRPWRLLIIVYALPSLFVAAMLSILPESPKYLLSRGKHDRTLRILTRMFVINKNKKSHEYPVSTIILDEILTEKNEEKVNVFLSMWRQTVPLFRKENIIKTVLICYMQFGVFMSASALALWYPEILNSMDRYSKKVSANDVTLCASINYNNDSVTKSNLLGYNIFEDLFRANETDQNNEVCDDTVNTSVFPVVLSIGAAIGISYIVIGILVNKIDKKYLLVAATVITGICGLIAQYISGYMTIQILTGIYLLISSCIGIVNALVVDLYPTNIRAMALAISLMFGRFGAMVGSNVVGNIFYNYCDYMFIMFAINHLILIAAIVLLPTKKISKILLGSDK